MRTPAVPLLLLLLAAPVASGERFTLQPPTPAPNRFALRSTGAPATPAFALKALHKGGTADCGTPPDLFRNGFES